MSNWTVIFAVLLIMFVVLFVLLFAGNGLVVLIDKGDTGIGVLIVESDFERVIPIDGFLRESTLLRTVVLCNPLTQQKISEMEVATKCLFQNVNLNNWFT